MLLYVFFLKRQQIGTAFVLQQRKYEDIFAKTKAFKFFKNKSKQTLCGSCIV